MTRIEKPWGWEEILENNTAYTVKRLFMQDGHQCSYQYHKKKLETILVLRGVLTIVLATEEIVLKEGEIKTIPPPQPHRMRASHGDCLYLECSTSQLGDVVRISDDYGRVH